MKKEVLVLSGRLFIYYHITQQKNPSTLGTIHEQAISIVGRGTKNNWWASLWESSISWNELKIANTLVLVNIAIYRVERYLKFKQKFASWCKL